MRIDFLNSEEIIEAIKEFCYNYSKQYTYSHEQFQTDFANFLQENRCSVIKEHELIFDYVKANGEIVKKRESV